MFDFLLQTSINALYAAAYLSLVSVGLVLIFGVMGIINFAHGELYMVGAYVVVAVFGQLGAPYLLSVLVATGVVGLIGLFMERTMFRPLRANPLAGLVASIGFLTVLQALAAIIFGVKMANIPPFTKGVLQITANSSIPVHRLLVIGVAFVSLALLWLFLKKTKMGWALRASAQDQEAAQLQGISVSSASRMAVGIGAALAGLAGAITAPLVSINPHMGHSIIVGAFIVIIVGGVGSLEGAIIASVLYAFIHTFVTTFYDGVVADIAGLSLMLLVLLIKPTGLFGRTERA